MIYVYSFKIPNPSIGFSERMRWFAYFVNSMHSFSQFLWNGEVHAIEVIAQSMRLDDFPRA